MFDNADKVGTDVLLLHGCPQNCMLNPVKDLLEVYEDMLEVLLVLKKYFANIMHYLCFHATDSKIFSLITR